MSGGSFNYEYYKINDLYVGKMQDADLDEMMEDLCNVLHDLEWWQSCDYGEETYRNSAKAFKQKWLRGYDRETDERIDRAKKYIKSQIEEAFKKI